MMEILSKEYLKKFKEYDNHYKVVKVEDEETGLKGFIAIHRKKAKIPALGATRLWNYTSEEEALRDALRLAHFMSYKSALAGLPYTGGKAALLKNNLDESKREDFFRAYAKEVENLDGEFVTGTDVGVGEKDIDIIKQETKHVIGIGLDPAYFTAIGVLYSIESCFKHIFGSEDVKGKIFAIQGLGKVGSNLAKILQKKGAEIIGTDVNEAMIKKAVQEIPSIKIVEPNEIYSQKADVFSPCALNGTLNEETISQLQCQVVCGCANNQLQNNLMGETLNNTGILYAPDYIVNSGGLISVVDEFENGVHNEERINKKLLAIKKSLDMIFAQNKKDNQATNVIANKIAEEFMNNK